MRDQNRIIVELALGGGDEVWEVVEEQRFDEDIVDKVITQNHTKVYDIFRKCKWCSWSLE